MPAPPVTSSVCPDTNEARGDAKLQPHGQRLEWKHVAHKTRATHKRTPPAASSGVAPLPSGICAKVPGPVAFPPPGIPRATFLPSISIAAPSSLAAVSLCAHGRDSQRLCSQGLGREALRTVSGPGRTRQCWRERRMDPTLCRPSL